MLTGCSGGDDTGVVADSGAPETSVDSGLPDTGVPDTGLPDTGPPPDGGGAIADIAATPIDTGAADCGGSEVKHELTIGNKGTAPLTVNAQVSGAAFAVSPSTLTVPPGGSGVLNVSAKVASNATAGQAVSGALVVTTNDATHATTTIPLSVTPHGAMLAWASGSPSKASFGTAAMNRAATPIALKLTNTGNADVALTVAPPSDKQFSVTPATGAVKAGATLELSAGFTPTSTVATTATAALTITGVVCGTSVSSIDLSGQGGVGKVTGFPTTPIDFGAASCGGSAPAAQTITLQNSGAVDVHITDAVFTGSPGYATDAKGMTIPANGSVKVNITAPAIPFPSAVPGNYSTTLTVTTDAAGDTPHAIPLTESARGAVLAWDTSATPNFGGFGDVPAGHAAHQSFKVVNSGNAAANVSLSTSAPFSVSTATFKVDGAASQSDDVAFAPTSFASSSSKLGMAVAPGDAICQPLPPQLALSGTGQDGGIALSTQSIEFATACGATAAAKTFTITNTGNQPMNWNAALKLAASSTYAISASTGKLAPAEVATITVTPKAMPQFPADTRPSAFADSITITTDIVGDNPHTVALSNTPLGDILELKPTKLDFGSIPVSSTSPAQSFVVLNHANAGSPTAKVTLASSNAAQFPLAAATASADAGASSTPIGVTFVPGATPGAYTSSIALATGDVLCAPLPAAIAASGTGTLAHVEIAPASVEFGLVNCGVIAGPKQITLTNSGTQDYTVKDLALTNGARFKFAMAPADGIVKANNANQVVVTVTPIASTMDADPVTSGARLSDVLTITTDAQNDTPHAIPLNLQAQGVVVDNVLPTTNWAFGPVSFGATGLFTVGIHNKGNAPLTVSLVGTSESVFGLQSNPTVQGAAPGSMSITGTFTPSAESGTWADTGKLSVAPTTGNVFCAPLPASWAGPAISLSGSAVKAIPNR